ncbi:hypothetical protein [Dactylosporangium sp. NPDC048998]|uniref:hypothetical protein n=1 Tax=Dactylosporangium sp. NPDC048998 TaxID=3363976 RepID=UPI003722BB06
MTTTTQTATSNPPRTPATEPSRQTATQRRGTPRKATAPARQAGQQTEPKKAPPSRARQRKAEPARAGRAPESELVTWHDMPMPHLKVPVVHMHVPDVRSTLANVRWTDRITPAMRQPRQLLYYGGVGALAVLGVLEWPVALAAAAGVWVATHQRRTPATAG